MRYFIQSLLNASFALFVLLLSIPFSIFYKIFTICFNKKSVQKPTNILITGGSKGIGKGLAEIYSTKGTTVIITGTNKDVLMKTKEEIEQKGGKVIAEVIDVSDQEKMREMIERVDKDYPLDLVISNAGIVGNDSKLSLEENTRRVIDVNINGMLNTLFPSIERMKTRGKGQICVISSASSFGAFSFGIYGCTKSFEYNYSLNLRNSLAKNGINVSVSLPGWVDTDMAASAPISKFQMVSVKEAVNCIKKGLERDEPIISFPSLFTSMVFAVGMATPYALLSEILQSFYSTGKKK